MCGIAGIILKSEQSERKIADQLKLFSEVLNHRGPDGLGEHQASRCGFINRRLAIVDIAGGDQPIYTCNGSVGTVYNGEIYNFEELRGQLEAIGYRFETRSDTEVIVKCYEEYGVDAFSKFNGMFSFCIWDERSGDIFLARDRFGIKPLYIYEDEKIIVFASELRAILATPGVDLQLSAHAIEDYLTFRYIQAPLTICKHVRKLEAGSYLKISSKGTAQFSFAELKYGRPWPKPELPEVLTELSRLLEKAVKSQLMGEVPIGVLLSGGLDSSCLAYYVAELGARLKTFNIGFEAVNEFEYSRMLAQHFGLEYVEILLALPDLEQSFEAVLCALDEPIADPACFPLFRLAEELKEHVTVVLSGEGGDELFAGYPQYLKLLNEQLSFDKQFPSFLRHSWYFEGMLELFQDQHQAPRFLRNRKYFEGLPLLNAMLSYDMHTWMPENLMMKADKILMAHSLEGRFPFLDLDLFNFAASLPDSYKIAQDGTSKFILRELMRSRLPKGIVERPKMGFTVPVEHLLEALKDRVFAALEEAQRGQLADILNFNKLNKLVVDWYKRREEPALKVWTVFILLAWCAWALPAAKRDFRTQIFSQPSI